MGNFNVDLMRHNALIANKGLEFLNISFSHGLVPTCLLPPRICDNHVILIESIFTSKNYFDDHVILNHSLIIVLLFLTSLDQEWSMKRHQTN